MRARSTGMPGSPGRNSVVPDGSSKGLKIDCSCGTSLKAGDYSKCQLAVVGSASPAGGRGAERKRVELRLLSLKTRPTPL
jgi:hypothetical protein